MSGRASRGRQPDRERYKPPDGHMVVLEEADLQALPLLSKHVIDVLGFVPVDGLDPILFSRAYYAAPHGQAGQRPYALLVAALTRAERAAVAKVTLRTRERLAAVWPRRDTLVVQTLLWPEEVREPGNIASTTPVTGQELELASLLMTQMPDVDLAELHDDYAAALQQLVARSPADRRPPWVTDPPRGATAGPPCAPRSTRAKENPQAVADIRSPLEVGWLWFGPSEGGQKSRPLIVSGTGMARGGTGVAHRCGRCWRPRPAPRASARAGGRRCAPPPRRPP
ncbi:Ku protein [Streptomyces sp. NPDC001312]|uniref:Ku protein n=1 Tax=Streptomyces sp. NPDC001312 TaxID=3364561 RepID=UPI0036D033A3